MKHNSWIPYLYQSGCGLLSYLSFAYKTNIIFRHSSQSYLCRFFRRQNLFRSIITFIILIQISSTAMALPMRSKIPVAILPLTPLAIDSTVAISLTARLRAKLLETAAFDVMERERMEEILVEQGFQQTGACDNDECVVEAGRLLGISHIVAGSVGKVGSIFTLTIRLIDVETGRILITAAEDIPEPIENVLKGLSTVAEKLAAMTASIDHVIVSFGKLRLESDPTGALIIIDDRAMPQVTPVVLDSITSGVHVIRMQKGLLSGSKAIFVTPNAATALSLPLTMAKGSLKIVSNPAEAAVLLDQTEIGKTPFDLPQSAVGAYSLVLKKPGYVDYRRIISIQENETTVISAQMTPQAFLTIESSPVDCELAVDDSLVGKTPTDSLGIAPGYHKITILKPGYVPFTVSQSFRKGKTTSLQINLEIEAILKITSTPSGAQVSINGEPKGVTPLTISGLAEGPLNIQTSMSAYQDVLEQVILKKGETLEHHVSLQKKQGKLLVQSVPSAATVTIDGEPAGLTPLQLNNIDFGDHLLRVTKSEYSDHEERITITDELPQTIHVKFSLAKGTLFLHPDPKDATILLDGKRLRNLPDSGINLRPGKYQINANRMGFEPFNQSVSITASDGTSLAINMSPKTRSKAILRSAIMPGWGQWYGEKSERKMIFFMGEIATLGGVIATNLMYEVRLHDYQDAQTDYNKAFSSSDLFAAKQTMLDAHESLQTYDKQRRYWTNAALAIWAFSVLDAAIFPPIRPAFLADGYGARLSIAF